MTTIYRTLSRVCVASACFLLADAVQAEAPGRKPNIVILLADDLGWNDVGYHGSTVKTPHIDRFVREGIELDRFSFHFPNVWELNQCTTCFDFSH